MFYDFFAASWKYGRWKEDESTVPMLTLTCRADGPICIVFISFGPLILTVRVIIQHCALWG